MQKVAGPHGPARIRLQTLRRAPFPARGGQAPAAGEDVPEMEPDERALWMRPGKPPERGERPARPRGERCPDCRLQRPAALEDTPGGRPLPAPVEGGGAGEGHGLRVRADAEVEVERGPVRAETRRRVPP